MPKAVFCIADHAFQADGILTELKQAGFSDELIAVLLPEQFRDRNGDETSQTPRGERGGVAVGAIGSGLGWLPGAGSAAIPSAGPFVAAGPALSILRRGSAAGLNEVLTGIGIPERSVPEFLAGIQSEQRILIGAYASEPAGVERARSAFQEAQARSIVVTETTPTAAFELSSERSYA
jgi:hypothetical protein